MSATDRPPEPRPDGLDAPPEYELACRFDDEEAPTEVTVFPAEFGEDLATHWLTMDVEHAVPLDRAR